MHRYTILVRTHPEILIIEQDTHKYVVYKQNVINKALNYYSCALSNEETYCGVELDITWVFNPWFATTFDNLDSAKSIAKTYDAKVGIYYEMEEALNQTP